MIKKVTLAFFSGTGGTKAVCDCFAHELEKQEIEVTNITIPKGSLPINGRTDLLIVFFPVYAFRMPDLVEKWVKKLTEVNNTPAVVISVSGGGEVSPNTACREKCKRILKKKGYRVIYEKMFVMPSNFAIQADEKLNLALIRIMPQRVRHIIRDVFEGNEHLTHPKLLDRILSVVSIAEHTGAKFFGAFIKASDKCNGCALCVRECPKNNIRMKNGKPKFGFQCLWCMKCIYACPCKALTPGILKSVVLKDGFDIRNMCRKAEQHPDFEDTFEPDSVWQGAIDYIQNSED